jgi:hypothetical protein
MKSKSRDQLVFSFDGPPPQLELTVRQLFVEQIRRDVLALREEEDPWWKQFYQERIEAYRQSVKEL